MTRTKPHIIPKTSRLCITCNRDEIKEVRKIAIDLEIPEKEVLRLALLSLIEKYQGVPIEEIREKGIRCFLETAEFRPADQKKAGDDD